MAHEEVNLVLMSIVVNTPKPKIIPKAIDLPHWKSFMQDEYDALIKHDTWKLVDLTLGNKAIGCKWVFKTMYKAYGTLNKHKTRLITKVYAQQEGINYEENFYPIVNMNIIRIAFAMVA